MRKYSFFIIIAFLFLSLAAVFLPTAGISHAAAYPIDNTPVLDDLDGLKINGKDFSAAAYPENPAGTIQLIYLAEIAYGERNTQRDNYALYVYIYNPAKSTIKTDSLQNKIEVSTKYSDDRPSKYSKFNLIFCNSSTDGIFQKYRISDDENVLLNRVAATPEKRAYDVSGIELNLNGAQNATEFYVGKNYTYSGYAAGYAATVNAGSTLTCIDSGLNCLELKLNHTYYRTGVSDLGAGHHNQINTVYFSVPNDVINNYDKLASITAEWWEYKTKMAAVTSNYDFYSKVLANVGKTLSHNPDTAINFYDKNTEYSLLYNGSGVGGSARFDWAFNLEPWFGTSTVILANKYAYALPYVFYEPNVETGTFLDLLYTAPAGDVAASKVQKWIFENYTKITGDTNFINCNGRSIPSALFENYVDAARSAAGINVGYNKLETNFNDTFNLKSYDSNHSWLSKLGDYGIKGLFANPNTDEGYGDVLPFEFLTADKLSGTSDTVSKRLLVDEREIGTLKAYQAAEAVKNRTTVLFRFAATDYESMAVDRVMKTNNYARTATYKNDTYVASQTVFFDFDVIQLDFEKDGVRYAMAVVASPIDIINGIDSPAHDREIPTWLLALLIILAIIIGIVLIVLLWPIIQALLKAIWWVICLPFRGIAALSDKAKK